MYDGQRHQLADLDATIVALDKRIDAARACDVVDILRQRELVHQREHAWRTMQAIIKDALR